jgi:hypothetical protein
MVFQLKIIGAYMASVDGERISGMPAVLPETFTATLDRAADPATPTRRDHEEICSPQRCGYPALQK